ncbi:Hypothetical protein ETEE_1473 [Edwardsiella anguillarum ET080813]|uniref:Uncharacterized protein n=1 Tax=Edwardsiella anguillarum ET080813 TaxID=667120 RepID=A0A076LHD8_9GAMM|nr:Hypothetical protein ETEE_1473 [Edwardsiella anguillarum ET080813]
MRPNVVIAGLFSYHATLNDGITPHIAISPPRYLRRHNANLTHTQ